MDFILVYQQGEILKDKEENSETVVVQLVSKRADEYVVKERDPSENRYSNQTVYDFNSRYSYVQPDDSVVKAIYLDSLPFNPYEYPRDERGELAWNADVKVYAFPISRLTPAGE